MIRNWILEKLAVIISRFTRNNVFVIVLMFTGSCEYNDLFRPFTCADSALNLFINKLLDVTDCDSNNGQVEVAAIGGIAPYHYSLNDGDEQSSNVFTDLLPGKHFVKVSDANNCYDTVSFEINNFQSNLSAMVFITNDSGCIENNGSLKVRPLGGVAPFTFRLGSAPVTTDSIFTNLNFGQYTVAIEDDLTCDYSIVITVPRASTGVSWLNEIEPIITTSCAKSGCHVPGTGRLDFTKFDEVKIAAGQIKSRVVSRSMPFDGTLPDNQIQLIACWVDDGALEN